MSKSVILSLLARGNTGSEILTILDNIVADIEQENIDDAAAYFAALWYTYRCCGDWHCGTFMLDFMRSLIRQLFMAFVYVAVRRCGRL